jgi:NAD(P)H-hydrate epimerase
MNDLDLINHWKAIVETENRGRALAYDIALSAAQGTVAPTVWMLLSGSASDRVLLSAARFISNLPLPVSCLTLRLKTNLPEPTAKYLDSARRYGATLRALTRSDAAESWMTEFKFDAEHDIIAVSDFNPEQKGDDSARRLVGGKADGLAQTDKQRYDSVVKRVIDAVPPERLFQVASNPDFKLPVPSTEDALFHLDALPVSRERARLWDTVAIERYGIAGLALMENAGWGAAREVYLSVMDSGEDNASGRAGVLIICGRGNNGGDGLVVARQLAGWGLASDVVLIGDPEKMTTDSRANLLGLEAARIGYAQTDGLETPLKRVRFDTSKSTGSETLQDLISRSAVIVDALLGTGLTGEPRAPYSDVIQAINNAKDGGATVIALDTPSGLDCNRGEPLGCCVRANRTLTFGAMKYGFTLPGADEYTGDVRVIYICLPRAVVCQPVE